MSGMELWAQTKLEQWLNPCRKYLSPGGVGQRLVRFQRKETSSCSPHIDGSYNKQILVTKLKGNVWLLT